MLFLVLFLVCVVPNATVLVCVAMLLYYSVGVGVPAWCVFVLCFTV